MYQLDRTHIVTIEGLKLNGELNGVQQAMVECHGAQCGFCTPGFVVAMCSMFDRKPPSCAQDVKDALTGNLCRCTGYESIINSALAVDAQKVAKIADLYPSAEMLKEFKSLKQESAELKSDEHLLIVPATLEDALKSKATHPDAVPVAGGTDVCVYWNKRRTEPQTLMSLANVEELRELKNDGKVMSVGARVTLAELEEAFQTAVPELANILWLFGSPQIRNAGTLAGNIANGSPIADSLPFLFVMGAEIELASSTGTRKVNINNFYQGYKKLDMRPDELISRIHIPLPAKGESVKLYKVSKRKHLDISAFTAAVRFTREGDALKNVAIAYGGVAATILRLPKTEAFLEGKALTLDNMAEAGRIARTEITPLSDVRGSSDFRLTLAENILQKMYFEIAEPRVTVCQP
jgi:xanthine dehydrogenase small subunit